MESAEQRIAERIRDGATHDELRDELGGYTVDDLKAGGRLENLGGKSFDELRGAAPEEE